MILRKPICLFLKQKPLNPKKILDTAFSSFDTFNNNKIRSNLSKEELKALHNLCKQKHLVIQKADKGNTDDKSLRKGLASIK